MRIRIIVLMVMFLGLAGCGTMKFEMGTEFDSTMLEQSLQTGISTQSNVKALLGEPYGQGRALMPFHDSPRTVWTYYFERGELDLGGKNSHDHRRYLFVFFLGDRYDGYMWFDSQMQ